MAESTANTNINANKVATKVTDTVKDEVRSLTATAKEGARSTAYLYPLKGIFYFVSHRALWKPLLNRLAPTMGLGLAVTTAMFLFTYVPQVAILVFTQGPLAAITTVLLVLSESSTLTMVLSKALLIEDSLIDTFDGTLLSRGQDALVSRDRQVKGSKAGDYIARLGKLVSTPFQKFTPSAVIRYLMYLPLNLIPVVGTAIFVTLQGRKFGPGAHARYFQLKGMSSAQREEFVQGRKGAYTGFGVAGVLLEMVPIAGILFAFTNTCGAALWAADLESNEDSTRELRSSSAKKAE